MTESLEHYKYIDEIMEYVHTTYPFIDKSEYCIDRPGFNKPPLLTNSCVPDFYCESDGTIIIGEAKTSKDIDNEHTINQFKSYILRCQSAIINEELDAHIIYMVPNDCQRQAQNILKRELATTSRIAIDLQVKSPLLLVLDNNSNTDKKGIIVRREPPIEAKLEAFEYQKKAVEQIKNLDYAAIFHEQGLGKTKIAMDLLIYWLKNEIVDTVIVVTKKSLVINWQKEFEKHTTIKPKILAHSKRDNYYVFNSSARAIVTNFESVVSEKERILQFAEARPLGVGIILDESAKIKNPNSKLTRTFLEIGPRFKKRVIMTGTPVANRPSDMWSQIFFLDQGKSLGSDFHMFDSSVQLSNDLFKSTIEQTHLSKNLSTIFDKIKDFTVRETKNSGIIQLPPKEYFSIEVSFDYPQKLMYDKVRTEQFLNISKFDQIIFDDNSEVIKRLTRLIEITSNPTIVDKEYRLRPPKLNALLKLVDQIDARGEKVIVWTRFQENVKMLKKHLSEYNPVVISGQMTIEDRDKSVELFTTDPSVKVLIATNAAKEGLTLTVANNAIFYDRSLSLDDYLQAQDRIHRISQTLNCNIYNIKVSNSIDVWIDSLLTAKHLAAQLAQGDITEEEYNSQIDYSFGEIISKILEGE